jgi:hypothetical protein
MHPIGFVAWLDAPLLQYGKASILKGCQGSCNYHQCSVGFSCVGLCKPHATLALWLTDEKGHELL